MRQLPDGAKTCGDDPPDAGVNDTRRYRALLERQRQCQHRQPICQRIEYGVETCVGHDRICASEHRLLRHIVSNNRIAGQCFGRGAIESPAMRDQQPHIEALARSGDFRKDRTARAL